MSRSPFAASMDRVTARLDALSSTELYIVTVSLMVVISVSLLSGQPSSEFSSSSLETTRQQQPQAALLKQSGASGASGAALAHHQPAWHMYVRALNLAAIACFIASLGIFCHNATAYSQDAPVFYTFLVAWSAFLGYIFSFGGVGVLYENMNGEEDSNTTTNLRDKPEAKTTKTVLEPPASTPVCSDPSSCTDTKKAVTNVLHMSDAQVADMVLTGRLKDHELEPRLADCYRAVVVRRLVAEAKLASLGHANALNDLPYSDTALDYSRVHGANCEIVVGYVPLPVGMVGPLTLNGESIFVPMATTEGCLVASTNRGAKAIVLGGGAQVSIVRDGITRAPCVRMPSAMDAAALKVWCEHSTNFEALKAAFESTTSFGKLKACVPTVAGRNVYLRLQCFAGDAMGMNMVSKGSLAVIEMLKEEFPDLQLVALSGNMCTDKKAAATNWIEGRGKSVVVEATIPADVVRKTLKTTVQAMVHTNIQKNLIGSAMAGTIGGFNAHASNMVTAIFLATGQDPAQNVESSNCITLLEETETGDLWISCTMPSLEVGTVGGGTSLPAQAACLKAMGCQGGGAKPGANAQQLAKVIAAATMAGELSLLAALASNSLVSAHMKHNRKPQK